MLQQIGPMLRGPAFNQAWPNIENSIGLDRIPEPIRALVLGTRKVEQDVALGYWDQVLTSGGCANLGAVLSCTDSGLTNGQTYYYKVSAVNAIGEGPQGNETSATPTGCAAAQLLGNPGFETGTAAPWSATSGDISDSSSEPPHIGSWDAWLDGYGTTHTDTLSQPVTLPTGCSSYQLSLWLHVDTAETTTTAYDTLKVQVLNSSGTLLTTLATYSNLNHNSGCAQKTFSLAGYAGQTVTLKFTGAEDYTKQTAFVVDDTAVNVS